MKKYIKNTLSGMAELWKQPKVKLILGISLVLLLITAAIPFWKLYPAVSTKPAVPLHYNVHFGVDLIGAWWRIFMPSIVGVVILVVNTILAVVYWKAQKMLAYFALLSIPVLSLFLILASLFITFLNLTYD